jgi:hypothetical protein
LHSDGPPGPAAHPRAECDGRPRRRKRFGEELSRLKPNLSAVGLVADNRRLRGGRLWRVTLLADPKGSAAESPANA